MSRYMAYPEYKDSGVEWVGAIPISWEVSPLFSLASTDVLKNDDGAENNVLSLSYGRIIRRDVEDNHGLLPESFNTYQLVEAGDIILRLTDLQNDKRSLRVGLAGEKGIVTSAYLKLSARKKFLDRYLYRLLHSYDTTKVFYGMGGGLRQSMKFEEMRRLQMLCPSLDEQKQIAAFLDHETAKIDALIEKQKRLIELLKEKRQAVISHAVIKGLNPNAPMKDSGVEWLGKTPTTWTLALLKWFLERNDGGVWGNDPDGENDTLVLRSTEQTVDGFWKMDDPAPRKLSTSEKGFALLRTGDLVVTKSSGSSLHIGKTTIVTDEIERMQCCYSNFMQRIRTSRLLLPKLAWYVMNNELSRAQFDFLSNSTTGLANLNGTMIGQIVLAIPSEVEQQDIISFLDHETAKIDALIEKQKRLIGLAQERRTALISAAVTGKIDVRDWQPAAAQAVVGVEC